MSKLSGWFVGRDRVSSAHQNYAENKSKLNLIHSYRQCAAVIGQQLIQCTYLTPYAKTLTCSGWEL